MNVIAISGNLTRDPETRTTPNGLTITSFSIANNTGYGDKKEVCFIDCVTFNQTAEFVSNYFKRGSRIQIYGQLKQDKWEDKETGQQKYKHKILADRVEFADSNKKDDSDGNNGEQKTKKNYNENKAGKNKKGKTNNGGDKNESDLGEFGDFDDDDLPF